jgi:heat shock protein HtpX
VAGAAALNLLKAWTLVVVLTAAFGGLGWLIGGRPSALVFTFCALLAAAAVYRFGDRALLGMLGARPFALAEDPSLRATVDATAAKLGVRAPQLSLIPDGFPRLFVVGRGRTARPLR